MTDKIEITREQWLNLAKDEIQALFRAQGHDYPGGGIRVSCGFAGGGKAHKAIGECWPPCRSKDGVTEIFISPVLDDAVRVCGVLVHELVHAVDGCVHGHKAAFKRIATAVGLEGKMTATTEGDRLVAELETIIAKIGKYPHAKLDNSRLKKKQSTRMIKLECPDPDCGYVVRTSSKWIEVGLPTCCCGSEMIEA